MNLKKSAILAVACSCVALTGCGNENTSESSSAGDGAASAQATSSSPTWLLASAPGEWREIGDAKQTAEAGQEIILRGRIGGRANPMSEDSPAFLMMDVSIPSCAEGEDHGCPKPWDYCCETPETIAANIATVIVLDVDGQPSSASLIDAGFEPLDEVIVVGTVDARPNQSVLTVRATGVHKRKQG